MAYTSVDGHRVYYETAGQGFPILLHHGFTQSTRSWWDAGWVDALRGQAKVVLFDALGHGRSDRPHDVTAYHVRARAAATIAVADAVGAEHFDMFGFSMGGRVAFELAASRPERIRRLVIGAMDPRAPVEHRARLEARVKSLRRRRPEAIDRAYGCSGADPEALALSTEALLEWGGVMGALAGMRMPTLLFAGERDAYATGARAAAQALPNGSFHSSGDVDHGGSFAESGLIAPALSAFLDGGNEGAAVPPGGTS